MPRNERVDLISRLQEKRGSSVITYITSDRQGLTTQMGNDAIRVLHRHLKNIGSQEKIDVFLYTTGGVLMVPVRMVHLVREYCKAFHVLVPHRALSAGTLLCLGADGIIMGRLAELSPVDPSTANAFNPQDPLNPHQRIPISVEDVRAYFDLAEEQAKLISEDKRMEVFRALTTQINTIALGNVHRVYSEIRSLAEGLLSLHMTTEEEKLRIPVIVEALTKKYTHDYPICSNEAEKIGLKIIRPDDELESLMYELFEVYEKDLQLEEPFNPDTLLEDRDSYEFRYETAYIETISRGDAFIQTGVVERPPPEAMRPPVSPIPGIQLPLIRQVMVRFKSRRWEQISGE